VAVAVPTPESAPALPKGEVLPATSTPAGGGGWRSHLGSLLFLLPGALWLLLIVVYPFIATVIRSFFDGSGNNFIGINNYKAIFSTTDIIVSLKNNVVWVVLFPFLVTFFGLVFAVLTERIKWSTAFKTIVFMPLVFSATAAGLTWASIFFIDPHTGMVNAAIQGVSNTVNPAGLYPIDPSSGQSVSTLAATGTQVGPSGSLQSKTTVNAGRHRGTRAHRYQFDDLATERCRPGPSARRIVGGDHRLGLARFLPHTSDLARTGIPRRGRHRRAETGVGGLERHEHRDCDHRC